MKRTTSIVSIVAVVVLAAFLAGAAFTSSSKIYIEADERSQDRGYVGFDLTTFRQDRYLIEAIVEGTDGLYRDRKIIMSNGSTSGHPWTLFDIVTEADSAEVWFGYVDGSTVVVKVDDEPFLEFVVDANGEAELTDFNEEVEIGFAVIHSFIGLLDDNLGTEIANLSTVVAQVTPGPNVPPCWGGGAPPCDPGTPGYGVGPGVICTTCCNCCATSTVCTTAAQRRLCKSLCQVYITAPAVPGPGGAPPNRCICP